MWLFRTTAIAALAMLACSFVGNAQFIEPKGNDIAENEFVFNFDHDMTVFGESFLKDKTHHASRTSGRILLGSNVAISDFDLAKLREFQMLQPSETYLSFRINTLRFWQGKLTEDQLKEMSSVVHTNFWKSGDFNAIGGRIFTWEAQRPELIPTKNNTFQAALIYNESSTYALYNYINMDFSDPLADHKTMAGFSRGKSFESAFLPFTDSAIGQLAKVSGVGDRRLGRFIYRIDSWPPKRGGCLTADPPAEADRTLSTTVSQDSVLGGSLAIVTGRCPEIGSTGTCFVTMNGKAVGESPAQNCSDCGTVFLACQVPPSFREGRATLSLSLNTQEIRYSTAITFVSPDEPGIQRISLTGGLENWMKITSQNLRISYNPAALRGELKLQVVGYSEGGLSKIDSTSTNNPVKVLHEVTASSEGAMDLSSVTCPSNLADCETHHVGYLQIVDSSSPVHSIRSRVIPLGWFVHKYYTDKGQPQWYREKCKDLSSTDEQTTKVRTQLQALSCPPTLLAARADASRYLRMTYCPQLPGGCASATPKQQCFVSRPETNVDTHGAPGSVCCYDDTNGNILYQELINDSESPTQQGSGSVRSHPDGIPLAETLLPGQVSFMSHWYWDTLKFLYCCRWSNMGDCPFYFMHERPSPKASTYVPGRAVSTVGDPHLTSFSGQPFLFNGYGEYWLLHSDNFQVQGRFLKLPNIDNATFLVSLSVRLGTGASFVVTVLPTGTDPRFRVDRRVGTEGPTEIRVTTDSPYAENGVTIQLNHASNLVIQMISNTQSVGVDLYAVSGFDFMNAFIAVSSSMKGQTKGLLGRWTDEPRNEFVDVDGNVAVYNTDAREFHRIFCSKNQLKTVAESLFNYDEGREVGFRRINEVDASNYRPIYSADGLLPHGQEDSSCKSDQNCVFDIRVTKNVQIAELTELYNREFNSLKASSNSSDSYCDKPAIRGIFIAADKALSEGTTFTVVCASKLRSSRADQQTVCTRNSAGKLTWNPAPDSLGVECAIDPVDPGQSGQANVGLIVGIVVPIAVLLIVAVVVVIIIVKRRSNNNGSGGGVRAAEKSSSRTTITSGESDRGAGYDNHAQGNRRVPSAHGNSGAGVREPTETGAMGGAAAPPSDDLRRSYEQAQMEPMEPAEFNPNQYAEVKQSGVGKSEVV